MKSMTLACAGLMLLVTALPAYAGPEDFKTGPVIETFGPVAPMQEGWTLSPDAQFRVAFDAAKAAKADGLNRTLESAARFINMHAAAGVRPSNIDVAVVVHGGAAFDLLENEAYAKAKDGQSNANTPLIVALLDNNVRIILCGQTAAYRDITKGDLLPGIEVDLSAMTAHARLQQDGYTVNPF